MRLDPKLIEEVRIHTGNLTRAVEDGLRLWLKQARRTAKAKGPEDGLTRP